MPLSKKEFESICKEIGESTISKPITDLLIENTLKKYLSPVEKVKIMIEKFYDKAYINKEDYNTCISVLGEFNDDK